MKTPVDKPTELPTLRRFLMALGFKKKEKYINTGATASEVQSVECRGPRPDPGIKEEESGSEYGD